MSARTAMPLSGGPGLGVPEASNPRLRPGVEAGGVERYGEGWRVLELGAEGSGGSWRTWLVISPHVREDEIGALLADLLHELARPGTSVRCLA